MLSLLRHIRRAIAKTANRLLYLILPKEVPEVDDATNSTPPPSMGHFNHTPYNNIVCTSHAFNSQYGSNYIQKMLEDVVEEIINDSEFQLKNFPIEYRKILIHIMLEPSGNGLEDAGMRAWLKGFLERKYG